MRLTKGFNKNRICSFPGKWIAMFILAVIVLSSGAFMAATLPGTKVTPSECFSSGCVRWFDVAAEAQKTSMTEAAVAASWSLPSRGGCEVKCEPQAASTFWVLEVFCVVVFTTEYLGRLFTCHTVRTEIM